jgi:hypothetical protein
MPLMASCSRSGVIKIEFYERGLNPPVVLRIGYRTPATFQNGFHVGLSVNLR